MILDLPNVVSYVRLADVVVIHSLIRLFSWGLLPTNCNILLLWILFILLQTNPQLFKQGAPFFFSFPILYPFRSLILSLYQSNSPNIIR